MSEVDEPNQPDIRPEEETDVLVEEQLEPLWNVIIHNDNVTPYDFVIVILMRIFHHELIFAEIITATAHSDGNAHVGTYPESEARDKVAKAHFAASLEGFPLKLTMEPAI